MQEPYGKGVAGRPGPVSYAGDDNIVGVALTEGTRRPAMELRNHSVVIHTARPRILT